MRADAPPSSSRPPPRVVPVASRAFTTSREAAASGAAASSASSIWLRTGTAGCRGLAEEVGHGLGVADLDDQRGDVGAGGVGRR